MTVFLLSLLFIVAVFLLHAVSFFVKSNKYYFISFVTLMLVSFYVAVVSGNIYVLLSGFIYSVIISLIIKKNEYKPELIKIQKLSLYKILYAISVSLIIAGFFYYIFNSYFYSVMFSSVVDLKNNVENSNFSYVVEVFLLLLLILVILFGKWSVTNIRPNYLKNLSYNSDSYKIGDDS